MRLLIQSKTTGRFLAPSASGFEPEWVESLREAGGGVVFDIEAAQQLVEDNCDFEDAPQIIDLDRLGTSNDYTQ
jgi:hypothetical protein